MNGWQKITITLIAVSMMIFVPFVDSNSSYALVDENVVGQNAPINDEKLTINDQKIEQPKTDSEKLEPKTEQSENSINSANSTTGENNETPPPPENIKETKDPAPDDANLPPATPLKPLLITKINTDGSKKANEYIEIYNPNDVAVSLKDYKLQYLKVGFDSGDKPLSLKSFAANDEIMASGFLVVRRSDFVINDKGGQQIDLNKSAYLPKDGSVRLIYKDQTIDLVGWYNDEQKKAEVLANGQAVYDDGEHPLQRCWRDNAIASTMDNSADFAFYENSLFFQVPECVGVVTPENPEQDHNGEKEYNKCAGLKINEIAANVDRQFIELKNTAQQELKLQGCSVQIGKKIHALESEKILAPDELLVIYLDDYQLKINKTVGDKIYLLDQENQAIDAQEYEALSPKSSWSLVDERWQMTFKITPNEANFYQEYPDCPAGQVRSEETHRCRQIVEEVEVEILPTENVNQPEQTKPPEKISEKPTPKPCGVGQYRHPETGRCRKIVVDQEKEPCKDGYERNPATGRCRKIPDQESDQPKPCKEGQYRSAETGRCRNIVKTNKVAKLTPCKDGYVRNPETGRCRKIAVVQEKEPCKDGYERNPETGRCRKRDTELSIPDAPFAVETVDNKEKDLMPWYVFGGVIGLGVIYALWQWKFEIGQIFAKMFSVFKVKK